MENNFGGGFNRLPDPNSFKRRNNYNSFSSIDSNSISNPISNRFNQNNGPVSSIDGRKWTTRDQAMVANKEYYKKIGRELNHKQENPEAFNLTNFYRFNKD